jgi:hypothetical protein
MPTKKTAPKIGDTCWVVRWCIKAGLVDDENPEYGGDPDRDVYCSRRVATRAEAEAVAREVYPIDQHGMVWYWPAEFMAYDEDDADLYYPHVGRWEETADAEYYEDED